MKSKKVSVSARKRRLIISSLCMCILLASCQVHRVITTTAEHIQKGDTATIIQTKTIESYVGQKDSKTINL